MSTKFLEETVTRTDCYGDPCVHCTAAAELQAIREAAKALHDIDIGSLESARDRVLGQGRMWNNTDAQRWLDARALLARIAKEET